MYLKKSKLKNGRIYLSIAEGYYNPGTKRTRTVNVKKLGWLPAVPRGEEPLFDLAFMQSVSLLGIIRKKFSY